MSSITYFQRYSQKENHATNNTMLLLRHFYGNSPFRIEAFLNSLLEAQFSIGLRFEQQIRGEDSVPDALVAQRELRIYFETKVGTGFDRDQIRRHFASIGKLKNAGATPENTLLVGLCKEAIPVADLADLKREGRDAGVTFAAVTFSSIARVLREQCAPHETTLVAVLDDYEDFLRGERLAEESGWWLPFFPCGASFEDNERFGVYFEPPERNSKAGYRFIGLYRNKAIEAVGEVISVVVVDPAEGLGAAKVEAGAWDDKVRARVQAAMDGTSFGDLATSAHRYYVVEQFHRTRAEKNSSGGIQGMRYLNLAEKIAGWKSVVDGGVSVLAERMHEVKWE
jgi:hypothetical protein